MPIRWNVRNTSFWTIWRSSRDARGQGIGSQVLPLLGEMIGGRTMLIEAENPACARSLPDRDTRQARIRFYQKGGMRLSGVLEDAFGVEYRILTGGGNAPTRRLPGR